MAYWLKADGEVQRVAPENGKAFRLEEMQKYVGGYLEALELRNGQIMWLNEEGKLNGLPLNPQADQMAKLSGLSRRDYIVGDVLVATRKESGEDDEEEE